MMHGQKIIMLFREIIAVISRIETKIRCEKNAVL